MWGNKVILLKTKCQKSQKPESHCPRESACSARTTCGLWAVQVMILFQHRAGSEPQMLITSNRGRLSLVAEGHWEQAVWEIQPSLSGVLRRTCYHLPVKFSWAPFSSPDIQCVTCGSCPCEILVYSWLGFGRLDTSALWCLLGVSLSASPRRFRKQASQNPKPWGKTTNIWENLWYWECSCRGALANDAS